MTIYNKLSIDSKPMKSTKMCHLQATSHNDYKSNQHIAGVYLNIHTKYEVSIIMYVGRRANQKKYQNSCHLKTVSQNNQKSNRHTLGINMNIHTKYEVSMTIYVGRRANQRKVL